MYRPAVLTTEGIFYFYWIARQLVIYIIKKCLINYFQKGSRNVLQKNNCGKLEFLRGKKRNKTVIYSNRGVNKLHESTLKIFTWSYLIYWCR